MYHLILTLGVVLWAYSHLMKRVTPNLRASLGEAKGKGVVALLTFVALGLMIWGYRGTGAETIQLWNPPAFLNHINNLLMLIAVFLVNLGYVPGLLRSKMRHPMLGAVKAWALAHLLVNGDLASVILFGGILAWAVFDMIKINKMQVWARPAAGPVIYDIGYGIASIGIFGAIAWLHTYLGYWPFG
jgi:uncharacterized membrane protein